MAPWAMLGMHVISYDRGLGTRHSCHLHVRQLSVQRIVDLEARRRQRRLMVRSETCRTSAASAWERP